MSRAPLCQFDSRGQSERLPNGGTRQPSTPATSVRILTYGTYSRVLDLPYPVVMEAFGVECESARAAPNLIPRSKHPGHSGLPGLLRGRPGAGANDVGRSQHSHSLSEPPVHSNSSATIIDVGNTFSIAGDRTSTHYLFKRSECGTWGDPGKDEVLP